MISSVNCTRLLSFHNLLSSVHYRFASSLYTNRRRPRNVRSRRFQPPQIEAINPLDDDQYKDHDFDFKDWRAKKYNLDISDDKYKKFRKRRNALYQDDDDFEPPKPFGSRKPLRLNHQKFEKKLPPKILSPKSEVDDSGRKEKRKRTLVPLPYDITEENRFKILNKVVIPYAYLPYEKQLVIKWNKNKQTLKMLGEKLQSQAIRLGKNDLPCPLEPIRASPLIKQYRNKDEFSVWPGIDGNSKTVGFFVGQPSRHEQVICVEPDHIFITKQSHLDYVKKFQNYLREVSPYDSCQNFGLGGNWRRIHIRSNEQQQHMITTVMHPQDLSQQELDEEMDRLKSYFSDDPQLYSLFFHTSLHTRSTHTNTGRYYHLHGDTTITETLFGKQFVISPESFFQINTSAAEVLYRVIMTEIDARKRTTVLDLCCGTGALSVLLSDHVKEVIAIDSSPAAIEDAKRNAELNNCSNIQFHTGTVEDILPQLIDRTHFSSNVVAVANPSRRALHSSAIRTLRQSDFIQRLIYVSCKPQGDALRNFVYLCQNSGPKERQFIPVNAIPVDLFPHTSHCELVVTFERF